MIRTDMISVLRVVCLVAALLLSGCSDSTISQDASSPVEAGSAADARPSEDARAPASSPDAGADEPDVGFDLRRDPSCPITAAWVVLMTGVLRDQAGDPLPNAKAQMCVRTANDMLYCIPPSDTDADGRFTVAVPDRTRCMRAATMRFLAPRTPRGATYCKIDLGTTPEITEDDPFALFDTRAPRTLPPLGDMDAVRTVVFDDGLEIDVTPSKYFAEYQSITGARVPLSHPGLCFLEGQAPFDGLYAFAPESDIEGRAPLRIPNTTMLVANRRVKLFVLGSLGCMLDDGSLVPEGEWAEVGTGQVSADGRTIDVPAGLPCLSWFAYRAE